MLVLYLNISKYANQLQKEVLKKHSQSSFMDQTILMMRYILCMVCFVLFVSFFALFCIVLPQNCTFKMRCFCLPLISRDF